MIEKLQRFRHLYSLPKSNLYTENDVVQNQKPTEVLV